MSASWNMAAILSAAALALPQPASAKSGPLAKAWAGTWQLDAAKSKFSSPDFSEKSETRTYSITGDRITMRSTLVDKDGKTIKWSYSAATTGKWYPVTGNRNADRIALTRVNDHTIQSRTSLHGKASARATASLSADGTELTVTRSILTARGGPTHDTLVYHKAK